MLVPLSLTCGSLSIPAWTESTRLTPPRQPPAIPRLRTAARSRPLQQTNCWWAPAPPQASLPVPAAAIPRALLLSLTVTYFKTVLSQAQTTTTVHPRRYPGQITGLCSLLPSAHPASRVDCSAIGLLPVPRAKGERFDL